MNVIAIPCAHCKKSKVSRGSEFYPFCSNRCKLLDLGAWVNEDYRIAGPPSGSGNSETEEEEAAAKFEESSEIN